MSGTLTHTKDRGKAGKAEDRKGEGGCWISGDWMAERVHYTNEFMQFSTQLELCAVFGQLLE